MFSKKKRSRLDGLTNVLTEMGLSRDKAQSTTVTPGLHPVLEKSQLEDLYRTSKYFGRIIDLPPEEATREGWEVDFGETVEEDVTKKIRRREDELGLVQRQAQADKWAGLHGGGAVVLGILDTGSEQKDPVNVGNLQRVLWAKPLDRYQIQVKEWETDTAKEGFGQPVMYDILSSSRLTGIQGEIHADRVLHFPGIVLPDDQMLESMGWGDSMGQRVWSALRSMGTVSQGLENVMSEFRIFILKLKMLELLDSVADESAGERLLMQRLNDINRSKGVVNGIVLDEAEQAEMLSADIRGATETFRVFQEELASAAEMPMTLLFGQAPSGLSTDNQAGLRNWYARIKRRQSEVFKWNIEKYMRYLAAEQGLGDAQPIVTFNSLEPTNAKEEAEIGKLQAETAQIYIEWDVLEENEVRTEQLGLPPKEPTVATPDTDEE